MPVKRTGCDMWQLECQAGNVTASVKSDHLSALNTCFQSFSPLINCIVHYALLKSSPCRNKMLPQVVHIVDWYSIHALLQHAADAVIYRVEVRTDELRCLTAQKLDCVTSTMCWRIVLLEDKLSSNAADRCSSLCISNTSW